MGRLDTAWGKIGYDYTLMDPAFLDLVKAAAAKLGVEVGQFMVETLRERATAVLNGPDQAAQPELPTWEAAVANDAESKRAEAASRALLEHAAVLDCLRQRATDVQHNRRHVPSAASLP